MVALTLIVIHFTELCFHEKLVNNYKQIKLVDSTHSIIKGQILDNLLIIKCINYKRLKNHAYIINANMYTHSYIQHMYLRFPPRSNKQGKPLLLNKISIRKITLTFQ